MSNRSAISLVVGMLASAVLFGIGTVTILSTPALAAHASTLLPIAVAASLLLAPLLAWNIAPRLRARASRESRATMRK